MSLYSVSGHVLLSATAAALSDPALEAQTLVAETALGLLGTEYTGDRADRAKVAVARQVNLQVASPDAGAVQSETRGDRSVTYVTRDGVEVAVDGLALLIVEALAGAAAVEVADSPLGDFPPCTSLR